MTPDKHVVAYCRIGKRSSHTWFVLTRLLGYERVKNYDGSWTEWGSMVAVPIEKGDQPEMQHEQGAEYGREDFSCGRPIDASINGVARASAHYPGWQLL